MKKIVQKDHPALRAKTESVRKEEFGSKKLLSFVHDMGKALLREADGVALAAPQMGVSKRLFIVSGLLFHRGGASPLDNLVFINPKILSRSKRVEPMEEGCLSVRGYYGFVPRSTEVVVEAQNAEGDTFTLRGRGLLAQIFQHEIDHLDGILFIDKARELRSIEPSNGQSA